MKNRTISPKRFRKGIYILPSLFTTGNVFCGFYAFIAVMNENYTVAAWAIVFGMIFDMLDGRVARLTNTTSAFGVQYDSLADVITFGMAPAFLMYSWVLKPFGRIGWMAAFLFLLCSALRLARFNTIKPETQGPDFSGLPTPASAAIISAIVIASGEDLIEKASPGVIVFIIYTLAFLMVSNIKYPSFKQTLKKKRVTFPRFLFVILLCYSLATVPKISLFFLSLAYVFLGPLVLWFNQSRKKAAPESQPTNADGKTGRS